MKKLLILGLVAIMLSLGLVLASCDLFGCPGGAVRAAKGKCYANLSASTYDQCTDRCITAQGTYTGSGSYYRFNSDKSCTCH